MHRGPDGVVIVTADMSISFSLHFCLSLSPLIAMFSMMSSGNTSTLRGKPRFIASSTALLGIAENSEPVAANTVTLTPRFSAVRYAVFCRPDQCSLTDSYVDNNSSLVSE
jgi:hypothetical protein